MGMKRRFAIFGGVILVALFSWTFSVHGLIPNDSDGDGVPDSVDVCPTEDASLFDRNGDGCIDDGASARHIEYWGVEDTTITYVVNAAGAPGVSDGSDFVAIDNAIASWTGIAGTSLHVVAGGTTTQATAVALDGTNLVTFSDTEFNFPSAVIAVGIATSFTVDSLYAGRHYRAGQIVDADMVFNPTKQFRTSTDGPASGVDIQSVATHEAGHLLGLSHSPVMTSTMFYVLPPGTNASSLESEDKLTFLRAYPDSATLAGASRLSGTVTSGSTFGPVPGAIVLAIDAVSGDTLASDYTLPDGSYSFMGLPDGNYFVAIYPLNGTSPIGFLQPSFINDLVLSTAFTGFSGEYYDAAESNTDDPMAKTPVGVAVGTPAVANLVTNVDGTPPSVLASIPLNGTPSVAIDAAFIVRFSEPIDVSTFSSAFSMKKTSDMTGIGGNASILSDDSIIVFTPTTPLEYSSTYELTLDTTLTDLSGNALAAAFVLSFTTEVPPALAITSLVPGKGVVNNTVVINGFGFDTSPAPTVMFNSVAAAVSFASPGQLVVNVPLGAGTGPITVINNDLSTSNELTFTVLSPVEVARGYEAGRTGLSAVAHSVAIVPDGSRAYVATDAGVDAVVVSQAMGGFLGVAPIAIPGGADGVAVAPDGKRVYAVSRNASSFVEINSDATSGVLFNTVLATRGTTSPPLGIAVSPSGTRAYIPTDGGGIEVWDVQNGSATFSRRVGTVTLAGALASGNLRLTPDGRKLVALSTNGELFLGNATSDTLTQAVSLSLDPRGLALDPSGSFAYVSHDGGEISVVAIGGATPVLQSIISTAGTPRGLAVTPSASFLYLANRQLNDMQVIDLQASKPTFRSIVADITMNSNPVDVAVSPDGIFAVSVLQGTGGGSAPELVVTTIGIGPSIDTVSPPAAAAGGQIVISGRDLGDPSDFVLVSFNGVVINPERYEPDEVLVDVPPGATTGPLTVSTRGDTPMSPTRVSNPVLFQVLNSPVGNGMRQAARLGNGSPFQMSDAIAVSPDGQQLFVGGTTGELFIYDVDPTSPTYHQGGSSVRPLNAKVSDLAVTADGKWLFMAGDGPVAVAINVNRRSADYLKKVLPVADSLGTVSAAPRFVATSPNNRYALVYDAEFRLVQIIRATGMNTGAVPTIVDTVKATGYVNDLIFSANGLRAFMTDGPLVRMLDTDVRSGRFGTVLYTLSLDSSGYGADVVALAASPDGLRVFALVDIPEISVMLSEITSSSGLVASQDTLHLVGETQVADVCGPTGTARIHISPQNLAGIYSTSTTGHSLWRRGGNPASPISRVGLLETQTPHDGVFTPDGTRFYVANTAADSVTAYDFTLAQDVGKESGDGQNGVAGQTLAAPIRVRVFDVAGNARAGVTLSFHVDPGSGSFTAGAFQLQTISTATDTSGFAEATWVLGPSVGTQTATVTGAGLIGSPLTFTANATADPDTLPLSLAEMLPLDGSGNVSVTTTLRLTFSRGVDVFTVDPGTVGLRRAADSVAVNVTYGFTDSNRKVSMTPSASLDPGTSYEVFVTAGLQDDTGAPLTNPATGTFSTAPPPPLVLTSVSPPSALPGVLLTLAGTGFDPLAGNNTVNFSGVVGVPAIETGAGFVRVRVPANARSGAITVGVGGNTSTPVPFSVLTPTSLPVNDVITSANTGQGTTSMAITPDGALAYSVSPDADLVIPVRLDSLATFPSIPVGDGPVAIAINPEGTLAYVANFNASSVSVINTDASSPDFNTVVKTLIVGANPTDVAVSPDGGQVYVVNSGSSTLSVIDGDSSSVTFHSVIATVHQGATMTTLTVSPDGGIVYIGTDDGYLVIDVSTFGVIASVKTGATATRMTVSPDGGLLYILTGTGDVQVIDVDPGSASFNGVIARVHAGASAAGMTVSPDGGLLYLIMENSDEVIVVSVSVVGSVSVIELPTGPPTQVQIAFVDTLQTGEDPADVVFDPRGNGRFLVSEPGSQQITQYGPTDLRIAAQFRLKPRSLLIKTPLNTCEKEDSDDEDPEWYHMHRARWLRGWIELPAQYDPHDIDLSTVRLNGVVPAQAWSNALSDRDHDGIPELRVKFAREAFEAVVPQGDSVEVCVTGSMSSGDQFVGCDTIRTYRPTVLYPVAGAALIIGNTVTLQWLLPSGVNVDYVDVHYSLDDGNTWLPIALGLENNPTTTPWTVPAAFSDSVRVMVTVYAEFHDDCFAVGAGISKRFTITSPVPVRMAELTVKADEGTAVVRWRTSAEYGVSGFRVYRADHKDGIYLPVGEKAVPAADSPSGGVYEFRDPTIRPNRTYWYKLEEQTSSGVGQVFGPYSVIWRIAYRLDQNAPNPFNPVTSIRFAVAADGPVRLRIYDVSGRLVRTLVDGMRRADVYTERWNGTDSHGIPVATGMYFYRLEAGRFVKTRKMLLLK